jgi:hypothetical protein
MVFHWRVNPTASALGPSALVVETVPGDPWSMDHPEIWTCIEDIQR